MSAVRSRAARDYSNNDLSTRKSFQLTCVLDSDVVKAALALDRDSLTPRLLVEVLGPLAFALGQLVRTLLAQALFVFPSCESNESGAKTSLISQDGVMDLAFVGPDSPILSSTQRFSCANNSGTASSCASCIVTSSPVSS